MLGHGDLTKTGSICRYHETTKTKSAEDEISVSPTVTVKFGSVTLENCLRIMRNSVFESLIFNLWLIIQVRRSEIH